MTVTVIDMWKVNAENFQKGFHNFGHLIKYSITLDHCNKKTSASLFESPEIQSLNLMNA